MDGEKILLTFLILLLCTHCASRSSILKNQTLKDGEFLISNENNFCLGFFSPGHSGLRYLGIWFHNIPGQTVIWVANRNNPINGSSGVVSINQWGNLVLHGDNELVWSTNVSVEARDSMVAEILDSGNLVLVLQGEAGYKEIMWQSFDHLTNTLIRGMKLGMNRKRRTNWFLTSWRSAEDPGTGNYSVRLNSSGSPQFFAYNGNKPYWRTGPWPWKTFPQPYNYIFVNNMEEIFYTLSDQDDSAINRLVLDDSGQIRWTTWYDTSKVWKEFWSLPNHRCDFYGKCGGNSNCNYNVLNMFECICLPGYEPKNAREWFLRDGSGGCIRKQPETSSVCGRGEGFMKVENVTLPDSAEAEWVNTGTSNTKCEQECKSNCLCSAYAILDIPGNGTGCLVWYGELIDTRNYIGYGGYDMYVRVDAIELADSVRKSSSLLKKQITLSILIILTASAMFLSVYFWLRMRKPKRTTKKRRRRRLSTTANGPNHYKTKLDEDNEIETERRSHSDMVKFNLRTVLSATNNFSAANRIGEGGFGTVYKGQLTNGQEIAVKRMSVKSRQGVEEFTNEAILIAKLQHRNLVKLVGFCIQRKEQILIYEYLQNKSLDAFVFDQSRRLLLDWETRFDIIVGIARGILYLHQDSRLRIIHRDLKCSNILLDDEMNPKISDFGMARLLKNDQIQGKTSRVVGTYGYMSPEYAVFGKYSVKSDVFSFGVILLEIISGKRSNSHSHKDPSLSLIGQVWKLWNEDRTVEIIDSSLRESYNSEEVRRCLQIGLLCVEEDAMQRPTMLDVVLMLKSETSLPSPRQPAFIFSTCSCHTKSTLPTSGSCSVNEATVSVFLPR